MFVSLSNVTYCPSYLQYFNVHVAMPIFFPSHWLGSETKSTTTIIITELSLLVKN